MYEKVVIVLSPYALTESTFYLPQKQTTIYLDKTQFNQFINKCNSHHITPNKLKKIAKLLDKEGF